MKYPTNSTAKFYYDTDGNEVSLYQLVRLEPEWARNRIMALEGLLVEALPIVKNTEVNVYPESLSERIRRNVEY